MRGEEEGASGEEGEEEGSEGSPGVDHQALGDGHLSSDNYNRDHDQVLLGVQGELQAQRQQVQLVLRGNGEEHKLGRIRNWTRHWTAARI